jgi:hypothetical protein
MIGNRGIDQDVQAKMDAYRGNPQALAQQYSQSQQLIDLLALQKLKSEKESAAREMQMKMGGQQMPTVADAREKEVLDLTKQELAQQTTGAMQTQQNQKQRAAKELVDRTAQMPKQSVSPMVQGVAGLQAPNMSTKAMAAGGIVAFQEGGRAEDEVDPALNAEMMRFIESQAPAQARPRGEGLAQRGIRTLIGDKTPQQVFEERQRMAQQSVDYTPEERAIIQRQINERAAMDAERYDPSRRRSEALTRWLLGAGGRTGIGSVLSGAGAAAVNYQEAMDAQARNALVDRQKQEASLVDVGPAARAAGMKYGTEAERTAMTGLAQGTGDAVRLEQLQAAAVRAGLNPEDKRIDAAYKALNQNPEIRALIKSRENSNLPVDSPELTQINRRIYQVAAPIFRGRGLDPDLFIPPPPEVAQSAAPASTRSLFFPDLSSIFGSNAPEPTGARRAAPTSGGVDASNPLLRTN